MTISPLIPYHTSALGQGVIMPDAKRNYCVFNEYRNEELIKERENALPYIENILKYTQDEKQILESLNVLNGMLDKKVNGIDKLYPTLSRFNGTTSPYIQTMLAGIYRKTLVPDAYGPLHRWMYQQIVFPNSPYFDPLEEIGGAIYEYNKQINSQNASKKYSNSLANKN